jgi:hypothetical protein
MIIALYIVTRRGVLVSLRDGNKLSHSSWHRAQLDAQLALQLAAQLAVQSWSRN